MLLSEHKDVVESLLELVVLDLVEDSLALVVQSCSSGVQGLFEVFYFVHQEFEHVLDILLFERELRVVQVHESVTLQNLQELVIEVVDQGSQQSDRSVVWVAVSASWSQLSKLAEDLLDGLFDVLEVIGRQKSVDWEVL